MAVYYVNVATLPLRKEASSSSGNVDTLKKGQQLSYDKQVNDKNGNPWIHVTNINGTAKNGYAQISYKDPSGNNHQYLSKSPVNDTNMNGINQSGTLYCMVNSLNYREGPGTSYPSKGTLSKGDKVSYNLIASTGSSSRWVRIISINGNALSKPMYACSSDGTTYLSSTKPNMDNKTEPKTTEVKATQKKEAEKAKEKKSSTNKKTSTGADISAYTNGASLNETYAGADYDGIKFDEAEATKFVVSDLQGIYGCPYQFTSITDIRVNEPDNITAVAKGIGRKYGEKIIEKMPLVLFTPGVPEFMSTYTEDEREGVLAALLDYGGSKADINSIISNSGRYYTFKFDYQQYFDYVEPMLWSCAYFLDLQNKKIKMNGVEGKLGSFSWRKAVNKDLGKYIFSDEYIPFYADSEDSVSESFSTDTSPSALATSVNESISGLTKEVMFLTGAFTDYDPIDVANFEEYSAAKEKINNFMDKSKILKNSKILQSLADMATTMAAGGHMYFPETWDDTHYSKSYSIRFKLRTPDGDKFSWFMNICVPLIHLVCLAAPRELDNPNLYISPFLVRAYCKGLFNCDLGIVTSLNISKGKTASWTLEGLPTEVDVDMDLKDLYSVFSMTSVETFKKPARFVRNIGMLDWLASGCGVNINKPELKRSLDLYLLLTKGNIVNSISNTWGRITQMIDDKTRSLYENFFGVFKRE